MHYGAVRANGVDWVMATNGLLATRQTFSDLDFWPPQRAEINPEGWLAQFDVEDLPIAESLLDSFVFFNARFTEQMFVSAFMSISSAAYGGSVAPEAWWTAFRGSALLTFPAGEDVIPVASGHRFMAIARDRMGFEQNNMYNPADLVQTLASRDSAAALIIVDDFLGSGTQFLEMWSESVVASGRTTSLGEEVTRTGCDCYFVVAVANSTGRDALLEDAPGVRLHASHVLDARTSIAHPETVAVATGLRAGVPEFVTKYSARAGIAPEKIWGFENMAATIGFDHGVPDCTLPLYWHSSETWVPLRRYR